MKWREFSLGNCRCLDFERKDGLSCASRPVFVKRAADQNIGHRGGYSTNNLCAPMQLIDFKNLIYGGQGGN
jgi:hypothetical protein